MYKLLIYFLILYISFTRCRLVPLFLLVLVVVVFFYFISPFVHFFVCAVVVLLLVCSIFYLWTALWTKWTLVLYAQPVYWLCVFVISCVSCKCSIVLSRFFSPVHTLIEEGYWMANKTTRWMKKMNGFMFFEPDLQLIFYVKYETKAWGDGDGMRAWVFVSVAQLPLHAWHRWIHRMCAFKSHSHVHIDAYIM